MDNNSFFTELVQNYYERLRTGNIHWYESNNGLFAAPTFVTSIDGVLARVILDLNLTEEDIRAEARSINVYLNFQERTRALKVFSKIKEGYYPDYNVALESKIKVEEKDSPFGLEKIEPFSYLCDQKFSCWKGSLPSVREAIGTLDLTEGRVLVLGIPIRDTLSLRLEKDSSYQILHRVKGSTGEILTYSNIVDKALE